MQTPDDHDLNGGMEFFLTHPSREVDVSHYFRQTTITRRREVPWINRVWCRNRKLPAKASVWKH